MFRDAGAGLARRPSLIGDVMTELARRSSLWPVGEESSFLFGFEGGFVG